MEHEKAIETKAAERYVLGEMTDDERALFEEHYFDCSVCVADVTDATRLVVVGHIVASEPEQPSNVVPMPPRRMQWIPAAAAATLIFGLLGTGAYRVAQMRQERSSQSARIVRIDTGTARAGNAQNIVEIRSGDGLRFDIEPKEDAAQYAVKIQCGGEEQFNDDISREKAADAVVVRPGELPAGRCELVIEGVRKDGNRFSITDTPFDVVER